MDKIKLSNVLTKFIERHHVTLDKITPIKVDASKRKYYRIQKGKQFFILMDSSLEKKSMKNFIKISKWLIENHFSSPFVYENDLSEGICVIEDFGKNNFNRIIQNKPEKKKILYLSTIELLSELSKVPVPNFLAFYTFEIFKSELDIFLKWEMSLKNKRCPEFIKDWNYLWKNYYALLKKTDFNTTVLKDFHIDNLFFLENRSGIRKIGLIDFQDALIGHKCYDLVSLLQDVRVDIPTKKRNFLYNHYVTINNISEDSFEDSYFIFGTQRLLKIIGIFNRLKYKYKKPQYMSYIPRTLSLLNHNLNKPLMNDLKIILKGQMQYEFK